MRFGWLLLGSAIIVFELQRTLLARVVYTVAGRATSLFGNKFLRVVMFKPRELLAVDWTKVVHTSFVVLAGADWVM